LLVDGWRSHHGTARDESSERPSTTTRISKSVSRALVARLIISSRIAKAWSAATSPGQAYAKMDLACVPVQHCGYDAVGAYPSWKNPIHR